MKRLYVAFALIGISVAVCLCGNNEIKKSAIRMQEHLALTAIEIKSGNKETASALLKEGKAEWSRTETLFSFIIDADKIEEMSISFIMIEKLLGDGSTEHALERLHECELMLDEIRENEKLSIKNVM